MHDAARRCWRQFTRPRAVLSAFRRDEVLARLVEAERRVEQEGVWAAGFIAYEAAPAFDPALRTLAPVEGLPLLWLGLYDAPRRHAALPSEIFCPAPAESPPWQWEISVDRAQYHRAFQRVKTMIHRGETYQVNLTHRLNGAIPPDPRGLFASMVSAQAPDYAAYLELDRWTICSASPELFFERRDAVVRSIPMKGTRTRGLWVAQDLEQARRLRRSVKERAENAMIVDMTRNDLGRIAEPGSVRIERLFDTLRFPTVWQMVTTVTARTRGSTADVMRALFPAASITGAPKARTMAIVTEVESSPRGVYTGSIGFLAPGRRAQFNVAIRTVVGDRQRKTAVYGVGGGIVWDARETREYAECVAKTRVLGHREPDFDLLETIAWTPTSGWLLLAAHVRRISASAAYFNRPCDRDAIRRALREHAAGWKDASRRVRLRLDAAGRIHIESMRLRGDDGPLRVCLADDPVDPSDPLLYHKTTRRERYEAALRSHPECDDVILWNPRGEMTEACIANLVVTLDGADWTPPLRCGLLPGLMRAELLRRGHVRERVLTRGDLARAARVRLVNSVRGLREVCLPVEGV